MELWSCREHLNALKSGGVTLAGWHLPTKVPYHHLITWKGQRKYTERLVGQDKDGGKPITNYCYRQNRPDLEKLIYFIANQIRIQVRLSETLLLLLMASALEGPSWKCWHCPWDTGKVSEASLQSHPHSTPTLPPKPCHANPVLLTKPLCDLQEIRDKQNKQCFMIRILLLIKQLPLVI